MTTTTRFSTAAELDRLCVDTIRMLSIDAVEQANSGHPGTPMALAPIGYVLFTRVMRHSPEQRTHIAPGAPHKQDTAAAHGAPLGEEEVRLTKRAYGWPEEEPFHVPEEARAHFRAVRERGAELYGEWQERLRATGREHPELANELERLIRRQLPEGCDEGVPRFHATGTMTATRKSSHAVLQWAAARVPELVGGSADLAPSTLTVIDGADDVQPGTYAGRNLHFGVREHAMGAIVNGLTLHYLRAYGSTFLVFSDYMRGSIRLAALMGVPSIFVFTHDSIGLGQDGPTHQPIEQLAGLRAMRGLAVIRPAGANETALAWRYAIAAREHPSALILSRQGVPSWNPAAVPRRRDRARRVRATRVLSRAAPAGADPDRDRLRGSHLCPSRRLARGRGDRHPARERAMRGELRRTERSYRDRVLPPGVKARVSLEAASTNDWCRWVGDLGEAIGMQSFGSSGPAGALYKHFGLTPERVALAGRRSVRRARERVRVR